MRQYFANGEQVIVTLGINRSAVSLRHLVPFFFVTVAGFLLLGAIESYVGRWALFAAIVGYTLTCLISAIAIGIKNGFRFAWLAPWIFLIIHVSYGVGSWLGVFELGLGSIRRVTHGVVAKHGNS